MYKSIPTYKNNSWTTTEFETRQDFIDYVLSIFNVPGHYEFNELSFKFNEQAQIFNEQGFYCNKPLKSKK